MGRLILHVGTHKTGTTSIQRALALHRRRLRERGIRYPDYTGIGLPSHYAHIGVANALAEQHPQISAEDAVRFFEFVRGQVGDYSATIISAEPMYRQTLGAVAPQSAPDAAAYWEMRDAYIARLRALTGPAEIVLVVRRQDEFAESMYQEHVKVTRYSGSFQTYLRQFWFHFAYADQADAWARHFGPVRIVPFDAIKGENITQRFLAELGIQGGRLETEGMQNIGMPHDGVILKRQLNGMPFPRDLLDRFARAMTADDFRAAVTPGKRSFFADAAARQAFLSRHDAGNLRLARMAARPEGALFSTAIPEGLRYGDDLPAAERQRLADLLQAQFPQQDLSALRTVPTP